MSQSLLRVVCYLATDVEALGEMYQVRISVQACIGELTSWLKLSRHSLCRLPQVGIIPVLASLLGTAVREMATNVQSNSIPGGRERLTELQVQVSVISLLRHIYHLPWRPFQLVCTALTRIAEDDEMAYQIRQCNCVTLLGKLVLAQDLPSSGRSL